MGGSRYQNAYGCLRCREWVGLKNKKCLRMLTLSWVGGSKKTQMLTDPYDVVDGGFQIFKRVLMFIQPKSETRIFKNWGITTKKTPF